MVSVLIGLGILIYVVFVIRHLRKNKSGCHGSCDQCKGCH